VLQRHRIQARVHDLKESTVGVLQDSAAGHQCHLQREMAGRVVLRACQAWRRQKPFSSAQCDGDFAKAQGRP
jgi:hypothetical protein